MLAEAKHSHPKLKKVKKRVYRNIVGLIDAEGYPTEANPNFKEANIIDLVCTIIVPIITSFKRATGRNSLRLERERLIISTDSETGGYEEFIMVDRVSVTEEKFVFIVEAKRSSLGLAMRQCLLSMKDMRDNNCTGEVYGFITTGKQWQMIRYDGTSFVATEEFTVLFRTMGTAKERWMNDYSVVVDCLYAALSNGSIEDNTNQKKRKFPWKTAYSSMTVNEVQNRIGIRIQDLYSEMIPVEEMLVQVGYSLDEEGSKAISMTKEDVYKQIVRYLRTEGYPESSPDFKESNVSDLVLLIILPILDDFMCSTGRQKLRLCREKQIVSGDLETGGNEEYVVIDQISLAEERYILIVEAKRSSLGAAMGQCLVSLKDMGDKNGGGAVYGFITTGESWRMLSYDGKSFQVTDKIDFLFGTMGKCKEKWMRDYSVVVDCVYAALNNGGIVEK